MTRTIASRALPVLAGVCSLALLGACAGAATTSDRAATPTPPATGSAAKATGQAAGLSVSDPWAKAADQGMTGAFAVLKNSGTADVHIVSASSPAATRMELHETVMSPAGAKQMQQKQGGFVIPAGQSHEFRPGADHFMLMGLTAPLKSGTSLTVTLTCADGSTVAFTAEVRTFAGAQETYVPQGSTGTNPMPTMTQPASMTASHG